MPKDPAAITAADVYRLFAFRSGARLPARPGGQALDAIAAELAGSVEKQLDVPLEELFRRSAGHGGGLEEPRSAGPRLRLS